MHTGWLAWTSKRARLRHARAALFISPALPTQPHLSHARTQLSLSHETFFSKKQFFVCIIGDEREGRKEGRADNNGAFGKKKRKGKEKKKERAGG